MSFKKGYKQSEEHKRRISESKKLYKCTPEHAKRISNAKKKFKEITKENLEEWYVKKDMTTKEIAQMIGCCGVTIYKYLKKYGFEIKKTRQHMRGERNPCWKGGDHPATYNKIAFRDFNFEKSCILCGSTEGVSVHHIDFDRKNNKRENMMILCKSHHHKLHGALYREFIRFMFDTSKP